MSKTATTELGKGVQKRIVSMFNKKTQNARTIAETVGVSRRKVMAFLEGEKLASYAPGSYN